jgi:hypothetical protein
MKLAAFVMFATLISCDTVVNPTQTVNQGGGGGNAAPPAGTVNPVGGPRTIDSVTIEVGEGCASSAGVVPLGCVARVTATPRVGGVAVSPAIHGPICTWLLDGAIVAGSASSNVAYVTETTNPFNLAIFGQGVGAFSLEAEVMTVRSAPRTFVVR